MISELIDEGKKFAKRTFSIKEKLNQAIENNQWDTVDEVLKKEPDQINNIQYRSLYRCIEKKYIDIIILLLSRGFNPAKEIEDFEDNAFHIAAQTHSYEILIRLLQSSSITPEAINASGRDGNTPLHYVATKNRTSSHVRYKDLTQIAMAEALLNKGANVNQKNRAGQTPLDQASNADLDGLVSFFLLKQNTKPSSLSLIQAVQTGSYGRMHQLLSAGCNVNVQNDDGNTALHQAIYLKRFAPEYKIIIQFLLDNGADPTIRNHKNQTPEDYDNKHPHDLATMPDDSTSLVSFKN